MSVKRAKVEATMPSSPKQSAPPKTTATAADALSPIQRRSKTRAESQTLIHELPTMRACKMPRTPSQDAKLCLAAQAPTRLSERDLERSEILRFLEAHVDNQQPGSLYVSGKPGTGKTALFTELLQPYRSRKGVQLIEVNCMTLTSPVAVFQQIHSQCNTTHKASEEIVDKALEHLFVCNEDEDEDEEKGCMFLVVLDEIDRLETRDNITVLYKLFEWPKMRKSRLVLIGIANALDLTDRILPMLRGRGCAPQLLHFPPYTPIQIANILKLKLQSSSLSSSSGNSNIIDQSAIMLCCAKVASTGGDLRAAISICKRVLDLIEQNPQQKHAQLVLQVCTSMLPKSSVQHIRSLPLHQKLVLCGLYKLKLQDKEVKVHEVLCAYQQVCQSVTSDPDFQARSDFIALLSALECAGHISFVGKQSSNKLDCKIKMRIVPEDIDAAFNDESLFSRLIHPVSVIAPLASSSS